MLTQLLTLIGSLPNGTEADCLVIYITEIEELTSKYLEDNIQGLR